MDPNWSPSQIKQDFGLPTGTMMNLPLLCQEKLQYDCCKPNELLNIIPLHKMDWQLWELEWSLPH